MCRQLSAEAVDMSRGITKAKYSHRPLKKRPFYIPEELDETEDDADTVDCQSEPLNLSMKPEDLRLTCKKLGSSQIVIPNCYNHAESSNVCSSHTESDNVYQQNCQFPCESSYDTNKLSSSSEYCSNIPYLRTEGDSSYYPSVLRNPCHSYETPDEMPTNPSHPSSTSLEPPYQSQDSPSTPLPYVSALSKFGALYQTSDSCGLSPTSSTPLNYCYLTTSSPPKTPEDLSVKGGVLRFKGSTNESTRCVKIVTDNKTISRYQCSFCSKSFLTFSGLSNHQDVYHSVVNLVTNDKNSFSCKYCEKVCSTPGALNMHIKTHTLPCKCVTCGKAFSRPWLLKCHVRTHTGEKSFTCSLCKQTFADRFHLRSHIHTHGGYPCSKCDKIFSRISSLSRHQEIGCLPFSESSEDFNME